jgi:hypothetical protein
MVKLLAYDKIVVFLKFSLTDMWGRERERETKRADIAFMLLRTVYPVYVINQFRQWVQDTYCTNYRLLMHATYIIDRWYMMHIFILSIHDVCYICHQSKIHVIECWCLFNLIAINHNAHRDTADWWMLGIWYLWHASSMLSIKVQHLIYNIYGISMLWGYYMNVLFIFLLYNQDLGECYCECHDQLSMEAKWTFKALGLQHHHHHAYRLYFICGPLSAITKWSDDRNVMASDQMISSMIGLHRYLFLRCFW